MIPFLRSLFPGGAGRGLIVVGAIVALLGLAYALVRTRKHAGRAGPIAVLLMLLTSAAFCSGILSQSLTGLRHPWTLLLALVCGGVLCLAGLVLMLRERRLKGEFPARSFGLLQVGAGVLVLVAALILPTLPQQFAARPPPVSTPAATATRTLAPTRTPQGNLNATPSAPPSLTPTEPPTLTPVPTETPRPSPTSSRPTGTVTPTQPPTPTARCDLSADANVNLRDAPSLDGARLTTIPAGTALRGLARSQDSTWWHVQYEGQPGWVSADVVDERGDCARLPVGR